MNILGLVLARKGSVRLKNKNIKKLNGKPLLYWSLVLKNKKILINNFLLSTDYTSQYNLIKNLDIHFNGIRPDFLATSQTTSYDVAKYEINRYEKNYSKIDILVLLQPTSPFRSIKILNKAINLFITNNKEKSIVSYNKHNKYLSPNGNFYITSPKLLKKEKNFFSNNSIFFPMSHPRFSIDIDTVDDYNKAKKYIGFLN